MNGIRLLRLPMFALFALLYTPGAAIILLIACARLLGDGVTGWRHARKRCRHLPAGPAL